MPVQRLRVGYANFHHFVQKNWLQHSNVPWTITEQISDWSSSPSASSLLKIGPVHSQISGLQGEPLKRRVTSAKHTAHRQARWAKLFTNLSDVAGTVSRMGHRSGLCLTVYVLINMFIIVWYCNKLNLRCWCVIMNMLCSLLDHYWLCKFVFCLMYGYLVLLKAALCPKQPRWTDTVKTLAHNVSLFKFFHLLPILVVTLDF